MGREEVALGTRVWPGHGSKKVGESKNIFSIFLGPLGYEKQIQGISGR